MSRRIGYDQTQRARGLDENPLGVFDTIVARAAECLGGTHPRPLFSREGRRMRAAQDRAKAA